MLFGVIGAFQFLFPGEFLKDIPFQKTRPLHVTLVISWILLAAAGGIYYYLPGIASRPASPHFPRIHFLLFILVGLMIPVLYLLGQFSGREYLEFPEYLIAPIYLGWILFAIYFFRRAPLNARMPVYLWQWMTGCIFILVTLTEAYLWLIPFFRDNVVRDITVQWKSYGAIIGSWNMLVYGTAMFVMCRISGNDKVARTPMAYFLYFLGFGNLLFNWGHHTYIVPAAIWIKHVAYIVSMTELIILAWIIWNWQRTLSDARKHLNLVAYRFILSSDVWIMLNLILALIISVPAWNLYTHGTHVTVAHAMGATIGINTMILLASVVYILRERNATLVDRYSKPLKAGLLITNVSLVVFWICLIVAGIKKGLMTYQSPELPYRLMLEQISPYLTLFAIAGVGLFIGITLTAAPLALSFLKPQSAGKPAEAVDQKP
jgi:nitric oxide reductase subunit B